MLGFSILMVGMQTMSGAVAPLKDNEHFVNVLTMFKNPAAGILAGILFTAVLQSASASVGILQALSMSGTITLQRRFLLPWVLVSAQPVRFCSPRSERTKMVREQP